MKREQILMTSMTDLQLEHTRRLISKEVSRRGAFAATAKASSKRKSASSRKSAAA